APIDLPLRRTTSPPALPVVSSTLLSALTARCLSVFRMPSHTLLPSAVSETQASSFALTMIRNVLSGVGVATGRLADGLLLPVGAVVVPSAVTEAGTTALVAEELPEDDPLPASAGTGTPPLGGFSWGRILFLAQKIARTATSASSASTRGKVDRRGFILG